MRRLIFVLALLWPLVLSAQFQDIRRGGGSSSSGGGGSSYDDTALAARVTGLESTNGLTGTNLVSTSPILAWGGPGSTVVAEIYLTNNTTISTTNIPAVNTGVRWLKLLVNCTGAAPSLTLQQTAPANRQIVFTNGFTLLNSDLSIFTIYFDGTNFLGWSSQELTTGTGVSVNSTGASMTQLTLTDLTTNRIAVVNASGKLVNATGTADGTKFLRDDGTLAIPSVGAGSGTNVDVMATSRFFPSTNGTSYMTVSNAASAPVFHYIRSNASLFSINLVSGNVGIGTPDPQYGLDISVGTLRAGQAQFGGTTFQNNSVNSGDIAGDNSLLLGAKSRIRGGSLNGDTLIQDYSTASTMRMVQLGGTTDAFPSLGRTNGDLTIIGGGGSFVGGSTNRLFVSGGIWTSLVVYTNATTAPTAAQIGAGNSAVWSSNGVPWTAGSANGSTYSTGPRPL